MQTATSATSTIDESSGPELTHLRFGKLRWTIRQGINVDAILPLLQKPESFLHESAKQIKNSRVVTIARVPPLARGQMPLILRRINYGKSLHRLRDFFRPSRAQRALRNSLLLERAGIKTPQALAACDCRLLFWPRRAYLVTEKVRGASTLAALHFDKHGIQRGPALKIAELIGHLHNQGLSHGDLKWTNIMVDRNSEAWLIDLDGVEKFASISDAKAQLDIARLGRCFLPYPTTLKWTGARFLRQYCRSRNKAAEFRAWADALIRRLADY